MGPHKLICFDIDGTLTDTKSSWFSITEGLGCPIDEVIKFYGAAMSGKISFTEGEEKVAEIFKSSGKATREFIRGIFEKESLKPEALGLARFLKENGYAIWLISGAVDMYVRSVAEKIGAAGFYAHASLEFDANDVLSKINYGGDQNPWKAEVAGKLAKDYGVAPADMIFVGDGPNDVDVFKLTGHGIAVYPYDEKLDGIAWKKVKSLSEIKDILK